MLSILHAMNTTPKTWASLKPHGTFWAIRHLRCPRCHHGKVFRGLLAMNRNCSVCGLTFEREPGYFLGAMYVSYAFASVIIGVALLALYQLLPEWSDLAIYAGAVAILIPFVPFIFRYSRVIWMTFDRSID
jgi:uncharacterized protein (DUF983 family)